MKRMVLLMLAATALFGCGGYNVIPQQELDTTRIFDVPNQKKDQLFEKSKIWIAKTFKSAKSVIEYENKENGNIIGNGAIRVFVNGGITPVDITFTMEEDIKDGRVRVKTTNMRQAQGYAFYEKYKEPAVLEISGLISDLEKYLLQSGSKQDW